MSSSGACMTQQQTQHCPGCCEGQQQHSSSRQQTQQQQAADAAAGGTQGSQAAHDAGRGSGCTVRGSATVFNSWHLHAWIALTARRERPV
jgi:hypothetical protein